VQETEEPLRVTTKHKDGHKITGRTDINTITTTTTKGRRKMLAPGRLRYECM